MRDEREDIFVGDGVPDVGADDPVRPFARTPCGFAGGDAHIAPPESMHILRRDTWVPPYRRVR